jgi:hypothetical protein
MTDVAIVDKEQARILTDRIKIAVEGTWLLIQEAYTSRAWASLGYGTWDAYIEAEFGSTRLALPREERAETVQSMRQAGMSLRAIAAATGISPATAMRDATVSNETVAEIVGLNGQVYAASRPAPAQRADDFSGADWIEPGADEDLLDLAEMETVTPTVTVRPPASTAEPAKTKRRPLPEAFANAARDLKRAAEQLTRLRDDDRFTRNRDQAHHQMPDLITALEHTTALIQAMDLGSTENEEARRWWAASLHKTSDALRDVADILNTEQ